MTEMRRAKLRFGLLTAAVSLLVFLIVFLSSLSGALLRTITGALDSLPADGLAYAGDARGNLQASRLSPEVVAAVAAVPGVQEAAPLTLATATADLPDGQQLDLQLFGAAASGPAAPSGLTAGSLPTGPGEIALDASADVTVGQTLILARTGQELVITGLLRGTRFGADTGWLSPQGFDEVLRAANPGLPFVPVNAVAFSADPGQPLADVVAAVAQQVPGTAAYTRAEAIAAIPGRASINQTFGLLVGITFVIGVVVVGFFFLILTVQKLRAFTLLRATGATTARLARSVTGQIAAVVLLASALATGLSYVALRGLSTGLPVQIDPGATLSVVAAVLIASMAAGLLSVRRIAAIDPATAAGAR